MTVGYQLVWGAMSLEWARALPNALDHRVLAIMCRSALDTDSPSFPAGRYFGGTDFLLLQLHGVELERGTKAHAAASQTLRRSLRRLEDAGAIRLTLAAVCGRNAEWEILVNAPRLPVDNNPQQACAQPPRTAPEPDHQTYTRVGLI